MEKIKEISVEVAIVGSDKCEVFEWVDSLRVARRRAKKLSQKYDYNRYDVFVHYENEEGYYMEEEYRNGECINVMEC